MNHQDKAMLEMFYAGLYDCAIEQDSTFTLEQLQEIKTYAESLHNINEEKEIESSSFTKEELAELEAAGINVLNLIGSKSYPDLRQLELTVKAANKLPIGMFIRIVNPKSYSALMTKLKEQLGEADFKITTSYNNDPNNPNEKIRLVTIKRIRK